MIRVFKVLACLAVVAGAGAVNAEAVAPGLTAMQARLTASPGYSGVIGVVRDGLVSTAAVRTTDALARPTEVGQVVRWASVSKMITAILVLQQVDEGRIALEAPLSTYLPDFAVNADRITIAELLRHRSGLANPDATPDANGDGMPDFYQTAGNGTDGDWKAVCQGMPVAEPGAGFSYNNCDYLVLGAVLEAVTGQSYNALLRTRLTEPLGLGLVGVPEPGARVEALADGKPEPAIEPGAWGPAGGVYGSISDLLRIDAALMAGRLMSPASRDLMWAGDPAAGYAALSVWSYSPDLKACLGKTRLIERYGEIGGVQVRNFLLPDKGVALAVYSNDGKTDFGEVWRGEGLSIDLIRAAACGSTPEAT